jgi:7,8-dihydro-6-hydroxymethylpterin dimethyltransferase
MMKPYVRDTVIDTILSRCPECGKPITSVIVDQGGKVYQRPQCSCHETTDSLIFSDADLYRRLEEWNKLVFPDGQQVAPAHGEACDCATASHNEPCLAVIDITNRCNFKCPVCFAEATGDGNHYFLDTKLVGRMLQSLLDRPVPCRHIQFSGGEPTLHPEFPNILRTARDLGFTHIQVATNGSRFVNLDYARLCEDSGLHTLYLQFDGVNDEVYLKLRGQRLLDKKIAVVNNVAKTNMRLVLVPTIVNSVNVDQLGPIFQFALEHSKHVTGISIQPAAHVGRVEVADETSEPFNLATMAREFGQQTGLTRFPDDWFPLNSISLISRTLDSVRHETTIPTASDAHCSLGTFFYVDDNNKPFCLSSFFDLDRFFRSMVELTPGTDRGIIERQISRIRQFGRLSQCFDKRKAPDGLTFQRLLRGLENFEDKTRGRSAGWFRRGFNGMFVAGMHFMDARSYNLRRLRRCIIQYVATDGQLIPFCDYNAGARLRSAEELIRLENDPTSRDD